MRVHAEKFRRIQAAELAAELDVPVLKLQLADQPHDLLQVE